MASKRMSVLAAHLSSAQVASSAPTSVEDNDKFLLQNIAVPTGIPLPQGPDPNGLMEYSVVYTDRALNHMSTQFQTVMKDISRMMKEAYNCKSVSVLPGSGSFAMEAVARQFATNKTVVVIRNGYFSYRWSQIFASGSIPAEEIVLGAQPTDTTGRPAYEPCPVAEVVEMIRSTKPKVVFAPHVETSAGIMLPDEYIKAVAKEVHDVGGVFVLDCIASGCFWVDMEKLGVDVLITAPQKGWSGPACAGLIMMSARGHAACMSSANSSSFCMDLKKWVSLMETYENGGHVYHCTMPTDALTAFRDAAAEHFEYGLHKLKEQQVALGREVRDLLNRGGYKSVAAPGFGAPGVVVTYTDDDGFKSGAKFKRQGMQIAAGVPLMVDEFTSGGNFKTFRLGLFGLEKLQNIPRTMQALAATLNNVEASSLLMKSLI